jgi:hypothetical protein
MVQMNVLRESDYPDIMDNLSPSVNLTEVDACIAVLYNLFWIGPA